MKAAVVGDTHGECSRVIRMLKDKIKPSLLLFTGDHYRDGIKIAEALRIPVKAVVGNCDQRQAGPSEQVIVLEGHRILLTHGHKYQVKTTMLPLKLRAAELKVQVVCFGHSHQGGYEQVDGIWFINPGSPTYPRQSEPSLATLEISADNITPALVQV